jgi:hypothetical protein
MHRLESCRRRGDRSGTDREQHQLFGSVADAFLYMSLLVAPLRHVIATSDTALRSPDGARLHLDEGVADK